MLVADLVVGLVIVAGAIIGARLAWERALPIAGAAAGVVLGSRAPLIFGEVLDSDYALYIAVVAALVAAGVGAAVGESVALRVSGVARRSVLVDTGFGAILTAAAAAVLVWALAPAVSEIRSVGEDVQRSEVLARFNAVLEPVRPPRDKSKLAPDTASGDLRVPLSERRRPASKGDQRLRSKAAVKRAELNLVKVVTNRCGSDYQGTGWIAGRGIVVTNAHVVSASTEVTVSERGVGTPLSARVIWFDGIHDLALLRVGALRDARGLRLAADAPVGTPAITLGFPGGKYTISRARLGTTTSKFMLSRPLKLGSNAGISLTTTERLMTLFDGTSGPGGSGSPVVDRRGRVLGTVFGGVPTNHVNLAVPNSIVRSAMRRAKERVRVPACGTPPLEPTRAQSIAARNG